MNGNLQYISDTILIDKILSIDAVLYKKADYTSFLSSAADSIMAWGKEHIDTSQGAISILSSLTDLMIPGVLFKINPLLGGLATIAEVLGFNPTSIIKKIISLVTKKISSGTLPTLTEINSIGKDAVSSEAGSITAEASNDMLNILHKIEKKGQLLRLIRTAGIGDDLQSLLGINSTKSSIPKIPFFGNSGNGIIEKIFGELFKAKAKGKAKWLLGGFVVWIIKTLLLGAGLVAAGESVKNLLNKKTENVENNNETSKAEIIVEDKPSELIPTGNGQDVHVNDHKSSSWIIPVNTSIENTLLTWAKDVYHGLNEKENTITESDAFNKVVQEIKNQNSNSYGKMIIPAVYKTRKQVVDSFILPIHDKL